MVFIVELIVYIELVATRAQGYEGLLFWDSLLCTWTGDGIMATGAMFNTSN